MYFDNGIQYGASERSAGLLLANQVGIVLLVLTHVLIREIIEDRSYAPGLGIGIRVLDDELEVHVPEVAAEVAFGNVCGFGLGVPVHVQPALIVEAGGVDHERVSVPLAYRVAHVGRLYELGERTTIEEDL